MAQVTAQATRWAVPSPRPPPRACPPCARRGQPFPGRRASTVLIACARADWFSLFCLHVISIYMNSSLCSSHASYFFHPARCFQDPSVLLCLSGSSHHSVSMGHVPTSYRPAPAPPQPLRDGHPGTRPRWGGSEGHWAVSRTGSLHIWQGGGHTWVIHPHLYRAAAPVRVPTRRPGQSHVTHPSWCRPNFCRGDMRNDNGSHDYTSRRFPRAPEPTSSNRPDAA